MVEFRRDDPPVLITEAARPYEEQLASRRRRYLTMMLLRMPCFVAAGIFHDTWWLAVGLMVLSVPLPWIAVLVANDSPPRKVENPHRYQRSATTIESGDHRVIDVPPEPT